MPPKKQDNKSSSFENEALAPQKKDFLMAALPHVPFDGWGDAVMERTRAELSLDAHTVKRLFPRGSTDLIAAFGAWADDEMIRVLSENKEFQTLKVREKIYLAVKTRLEILSPYKEAAQAALKFMARPDRAVLMPVFVWRSASTIWYEAGDTATDHNHYTKRALLSGVMKATTLYWLNDTSETHEKTWAFLEKRIEDVLKLGGHINKAKAALNRILPFKDKSAH